MSTLSNGTASIQLTSASGVVITLATEGTYVDKDLALTVTAPSASPSFDGGALTSKAATATFTNMTTSSSDTSGVAIVASGAAGRTAVLYNGAVDGWVTATDNATASAAVSSSTWTGTTYYATGVTLTNGKTFSITVPNGDSDTVTFTFTVDSSGNTTIT